MPVTCASATMNTFGFKSGHLSLKFKVNFHGKIVLLPNEMLYYFKVLKFAVAQKI